MVKTQLPSNVDSGIEPAPRFATDAEIKLADQLRRQLEEQYLGSSEQPSTVATFRRSTRLIRL
jgi:hypothetical protein